MNNKIILAAFAVAASLAATNLYASIDPVAATVKLQKSCDNGLGGTLNNCFTDEKTLFDWIDNTRNPSATNTLSVEIGPGSYESDLKWLCAPGEGYVSFRGAGRGQSVFKSNRIIGIALTFQNCENMAFEDLTVDSKFISVQWAGGGTATWTNVELKAGYTTWYETPEDRLGTGATCSGTDKRNEHKFFASTLIVDNRFSGASDIYHNNCGITWFYGSELIYQGVEDLFNGTAHGISTRGRGHETHLYGSSLRLFVDSASSISSLVALKAFDHGRIHSHGVGIDVISEKSINITALDVATNGSIHASESAYVLRTGSGGIVSRISNTGGSVLAPHHWDYIPDTDGDPLTSTINFVSVNGSDQTVIRTGTSDGYPHEAIYSDQCPASARWYDMVDKICRGN